MIRRICLGDTRENRPLLGADIDVLVVDTAHGHQERMMKKLGITARADLMRFAIREGLAQA